VTRYSTFNPPPPLTPEECRTIWRWERTLQLVCLGAALALGLVFLLGWLTGSDVVTRRLVLAWFAGLLVVGIVTPLRQGCPRCAKRLSNMWRFRLADQCRGCGVTFPRRPQDNDASL
jgi:hypothetical protein